MIRVLTYRDLRDSRYIDEACEIHNTSFRYDIVECSIFRSFVLEDPNLEEDLIFLALDERDRVVGFVIGVEIVREPRESLERFRDRVWIKDLAVDPGMSLEEKRDVLERLLLEFESEARRRDKKSVTLYAYAPYYFTPGLNILYEDYLMLLERQGFSRQRETVSYEIDLSEFYYPERVSAIENRLSSEKIIFRLGREEEAERVSEWVGRVFNSSFWRLETLYSFKNKPPTIWIAELDREVIGFSVYMRMNRNEVGPIGVDPSKRRHGVGTVLLFKSLEKMRRLGFRYAVIPWTDHLFFYTQIPGVARVKHYYIMSKNINDLRL
ncbi:MAG: GNAT family N-acetyltransferase, partial [Sulfolobales archaeon]